MANAPFITKFRAFQLGSEGSIFSYYKTNVYTLIEARVPKDGIEVLQQDLHVHGKEHLDTLHITSWDTDHCSFDDLSQILNKLRPHTIEIPDYLPGSDSGNACRNILLKYDDIHQKYVHNVKVISKAYIGGLQSGDFRGASNIVYESSYGSTCKNDMSLIKLFRSNGFNVFSLGDCESAAIAQRLSMDSIATSEVDVLILPHHGANNGFMTRDFLMKIKPTIAVCSSNYGNQYDHPRPEIRELLFQANIPIYTTKTGDVVIYQQHSSNRAHVYNLKSDNTGVSSENEFIPKRFLS